jgi:hypothetical protein
MTKRRDCSRVTLREVNQKVEDLRDDFKDFKENEFAHLVRRVEWILRIIITALLGLVGALISLILRS